MNPNMRLNLTNSNITDEIKLLGRTIILPENLLNYMKIYDYFYNSSKDAKEEFISEYKKSNKCISDIHNNAFNQGNDIILRVLRQVVLELQTETDINLEEFISKYYNRYYKWSEIFNSADNKYMEIILMKGHPEVDTQNKLFKDDSILEELSDGLEKSIFDIKEAYTECVRDNNLYDVYKFSEDDINKSNNIISELYKNKLESEKAIDLIVEAFSLNPYNIKIYAYILKNFDCRNYDIQKIALRFSIDLNDYETAYYEQSKLIDRDDDYKTMVRKIAKNDFVRNFILWFFVDLFSIYLFFEKGFVMKIITLFVIIISIAMLIADRDRVEEIKEDTIIIRKMKMKKKEED